MTKTNTFDLIEVDELADRIEDFLLTLIATVFPDVAYITDNVGEPVWKDNNYLLSDDGKQWSGIFYDDDDNEFPFVISEDDNGVWAICY